MKFAVALLALVAVVVNGAAVKKVANLKEFSYASCSAAPESIVISSFDIEPDPIIIPGNVTFSITLTGTTPVTSPTEGNLTLSYRVDDTAEWEDLGCLDGFIGSCYFADVCELLNHLFPLECPATFIENNVPCHCPFEATTYTIPDGHLEFVDPLDTLSAGDYKFRIVLNKDGVELQCYEFQVTLASPPAA